MPVIAVYSVKGGVGKTTLAVDLAWRSAQIGNFPTLLWELDQQGGAGFLLGAPLRKTARAMSLFHRDSRPRDLIEPTRFDKLHLLQADESLRAMPVQLARIGARSRLSQMVSFLLKTVETMPSDDISAAQQTQLQNKIGRHAHSFFAALLLSQVLGEGWEVEPVQLALRKVVAAIVSDADEYCSEVAAALNAAGVRAEVDLRNEKINYKVREHSVGKVPVILAVGARDVEDRAHDDRGRQRQLDRQPRQPHRPCRFLYAKKTVY